MVDDAYRPFKLEFGVGNKPTAGYTHVDKWKHSTHVDIAWDLEKTPWPWDDNSVSEILATDVFEHLRPWVIDVQGWLDECWRILKPGGLLNFRVPAWNNHYSWRDPTHYRVFHEESFHYWCPAAPGTVWEMFGKYYFGPDYNKWWKLTRNVCEVNDLRFWLLKVAP